jgi:P-type conjugative transfer protein TrbJ
MNTMRLITGSLLAALLAATGPAHGQGIPVFDASTFAQTLITAENAVQQVTQIANEVTMIQNQMRSLATLGTGSFDTLTANLGGQLAQLNTVMASVQGVSYQIDTIEGQFRDLFPSSRDWSDIPVEQYGAYLQQWSGQLQDATRTAMQSQAVIDGLRLNNTEAQNILAQSQGADGEVRQLQAVNEMLAVLTQQMGDMTTVMATSGRVSASAAAASQAERDAQREFRRRFMAPVTVPIDDGKRY